MWLTSVAPCYLSALMIVARTAQAIQLDLSDDNSIKQAASTVAHGMVSLYVGNQTGQTPGVLPAPYYWWEAGAMFGSLIDYWYYTGDAQYNDLVTQAMMWQAAPTANFEPLNQSKDLGNDDQAFWGMAAMSAAETNFPNPPGKQPQWLALAQAVFNRQADRWDNTSCNGGLKWQIFPFNTGFNYKNSISQGGFFNLASRLGAYTQNQTYLDWAERSYNWTERIGLINHQFQIFDGSDDLLNCTQIEHVEWTYNNGVFLLGAAMMWNQTTGAAQQRWADRLAGIISRSSVFFTSQKVMFEVACEPYNNCDLDQHSFRAYLARWMAAATKVAPWTYDLLMPFLQASAQAAAASCSGGSDGVTCGYKWDLSPPGYDGSPGVGQQMSALETIQANLIQRVQGPLSNSTGGSSQGNPSAGTQTGADTPDFEQNEITTADKVGAGILTAFVLLGFLGMAWWMII